MKKSRITAGILTVAAAMAVVTFYSCGDKVEHVTDYDMTIDTVYGELAGTYDGELTNSEVTGNGIFKDENDRITYEGQFEQGIFQGEGKLSGTNENETITEIEGTFQGLDSIKGTITVDGCKEYEGALSQYKHHVLPGISLLTDDFVYHGQGTLYNREQKKVYSGEFKYGKPVDKQSFMKACKNYSASDLLKYADARIGSLVKFTCNNPYIDGGFTSNETVFIYDSDSLSASRSGAISMLYQYQKGETRLLNGEKVVVCGIIEGYEQNNLMIRVLSMKTK